MSELPGEVVRRWFEAVNGHDVDAAADLVAPDMVNHSSSGQGREGIRAELSYWLAAFPDATVPLEDVIVEGDRVAVRHRLVGTHAGEFMGIAGTGRRVSVQEMDIFRVQDGRIVESWSAPDLHGMLSQISGEATGSGP
jgi:steroid delta-isomerase-like uncharacterized protein